MLLHYLKVDFNQIMLTNIFMNDEQILNIFAIHKNTLNATIGFPSNFFVLFTQENPVTFS